VYFEQGKLKECLDDLDLAIRLAPNVAETYANRARILIRVGEKEKAIADLERSLELAPKDWDRRESVQREIEEYRRQ